MNFHNSFLVEYTAVFEPICTLLRFSPEYVVEIGTKCAQLCKCQTCMMPNELDKRFG